MRIPVGIVTAVFVSLIATPASAQRFTFERSFDMSSPSTIDVTTVRGKIEISVGSSDRVVVSGAATVRVGWDVPANAEELARKVAEAPPITRDGSTVRLRPPADARSNRAVIVNYQVKVPASTQVLATSDSGAIDVRGVAGRVTVRTQSGAIDLNQLGSSAAVHSGSGAVTVGGVQATLEVNTTSSAITARDVAGSLNARTSSGSVDASLRGQGDVDIETGSSSVTIRGARGAVSVITKSGKIQVQGQPGGTWRATTGSGAIGIDISHPPAVTVDATTGSGSVVVEGVTINGTASKRRVTGTIGAGGPPLFLNSRSGSIRIKVSD
jgi:DUF4097 and DUF4098 domain-containing protein YvlB